MTSLKADWQLIGSDVERAMFVLQWSSERKWDNRSNMTTGAIWRERECVRKRCHLLSCQSKNIQAWRIIRIQLYMCSCRKLFMPEISMKVMWWSLILIYLTVHNGLFKIYMYITCLLIPACFYRNVHFNNKTQSICSYQSRSHMSSSLTIGWT